MRPVDTVYASAGALPPPCCTRLEGAWTDGRMHATRMLISVVRAPRPWADSFIEGLCMLPPWHNDGHDGAHAAPWADRHSRSAAAMPSPTKHPCTWHLLTGSCTRHGHGPHVAP